MSIACDTPLQSRPKQGVTLVTKHDIRSLLGPRDPSPPRLDGQGDIQLLVHSRPPGRSCSRPKTKSWIDEYVATIKTRHGEFAGSFSYCVLYVDRMREAFRHAGNMHEQLEEMSEQGGEELRMLCSSIFTPDGEPDSDFYKHITDMHTLFGPEIAGSSAIALIEGGSDGEHTDWPFQVKPEQRRRGIGSAALRELFRHQSLEDAEFIFVSPSLPNFPKALRGTEVETYVDHAVTAFFRKAGFRRVGLTADFFAYALHNEGHPSRRVTAEEDTAADKWAVTYMNLRRELESSLRAELQSEFDAKLKSMERRLMSRLDDSFRDMTPH